MADIEVAPIFRGLFQSSARYKAMFGGRGGGKSHAVADYLVLRAAEKATRILCVREVQKSIAESSMRLIKDKIEKRGLLNRFNLTQTEIRGDNGSVISFRGLQDHTAESIKSFEGADVCSIDEAQAIRARSWRLLRPTIRAPGSQIICAWNPRHETDPIDAFFRGGNPPEDAWVQPVGLEDNPWATPEMYAERARDYDADPEMAEHVWGGGYEIVSEASYYARLIFAAEKEGRIGDYPFDPHLPVDTAWDIGVDDYTSIWFFQNDGVNVTAIDFWEISGAGAEEIRDAALPELNPNPAERYAALAELKREKSFRYDNHYLPHDVKVREWGPGAKKRTETLMELGFPQHSIRVGAATDPADRINAARRMLRVCRFADTPRVRFGLQHLRRYERRQHAEGFYTGPKHDEHSHCADAFGEFAVNAPIVPPKPVEIKRTPTPEELARVRLLGPPEPRSRRRIEI